MRLDALIRVSRRGDREGESFRSPAQQRDICRRWADANGAEILAWHEAIDVSGKTMDRADVDRALERVRAGQTDGVIVAWLNRFSRAPVGEALRVYDDIAAANGRVVAVDMAGIDARDTTGELALTVMLGVNRMQWRQVAERWDLNRADAVRAGKAIGGAPFGYRHADPTPRAHGKGIADSRLVVHGTEAPIVRELFERKVAGATWLELARWLDTVAPKPNGGYWSRNTVRGMLGRRTYLGEVHHGVHVCAGAHEAIVGAALWRRAQNPPGRRTPRGAYLLTGLVRCAGCGRRMRATSGGRGKPATYGCQTPQCELRYTTVTVDRLDAEVVAQFFAHLDDFHVQSVDGGELAAAQADVEARAGEVERLAAVVPSHPRAIAAHQDALAAAETALAEVEDRRDHLVASAAQNGPDVHELRDDWRTLAVEERREILRAGIDAVLVRRASRRTAHLPVVDRIRVVFHGEAPLGLTDNGRSGGITAWAWNDDPGSLVAAA